MKELVTAIGLTPSDLVLVVLSPLCSILGSLVHMCLLEINPNRMPRPGSTILLGKIDVLGRVKWMIMRMIVGAVLGLVFAFYFVGTLVATPVALFKLLAFAVVVGYSAPRLWYMQEKILIDQIDASVRRAVDAALHLQKENRAQPPVAPY